MRFLDDAIREGDVTAVSWALRGWRPASTNPALQRALFFACKRGTSEIVRELLVWDPPVNSKNLGGFTPLDIACYWADVESVKALIDAGASVNETGVVNKTALHWATARTNPTPNIVFALIAAGAEVNAKTSLNWFPLHFACGCGNLEIVAALVEAGSDVNAQNKDGEAPLHMACRDMHYAIIELLLQSGANRYAQTHAGNFPSDLTRDPRVLALLQPRIKGAMG